MKTKIAIFYSFSSVSQPQICSSLSEPTLRSFSRHGNKTSASHARLCYVRTALVRAMERIVPSAESRPAAVCSGWPAGDRRGARSTGRRGGKVTQPLPAPRGDINLRDRPCTADDHDNVSLIMPISGDTLNVHSLQTMP